MELTNKQKKFLRGLGQKLEHSVQVGKAGLSGALVGQVRSILEHRELVKVRLPAGEEDDRAESARLLAEATGSTFAGMVGRNILLYRPNEAVRDRIVLPE